MPKLIEVYPKIGCLTDADPTGFQWGPGVRQAVRDRIQGIADTAPGVTVDSWHLRSNPGQAGWDGSDGWVQTPKVIIFFTVPDAATHADVKAAFVADGFWPWAKAGIRSRLPVGITVVEWHAKLMTSLGRTQLSEDGP